MKKKNIDYKHFFRELYKLVPQEKVDYFFAEKQGVDGDLIIGISKVLKENLSDIEYNILSLHLFSELTFKEISSKLNMKESSVKTLYFRTLKKSRKLLERR